MEQHIQNNQAPPTYSPPAVQLAPDITVTDTMTAPQQPQHEESEKTVTSPPPNVTDSIVPVDAPAKIVQVPAAPLVTPLNQLNEQPKLIDCPFCQYRAMTRVQGEHSSQTGIAAALCCIFCGVIGACIPYLMKWSQDYHHFCTNCGAKVAIHPNDGPVQVQAPSNPPAIPSGYPEAPAKPEPTKTAQPANWG